MEKSSAFVRADGEAKIIRNSKWNEELFAEVLGVQAGFSEDSPRVKIELDSDSFLARSTVFKYEAWFNRLRA